MSVYEVLIMGCVAAVFLFFLWKWNKALLLIILMEFATVLLLSMIFISYSSYILLIIIIFSFLVSEALVLLSSLYSSLRFSGKNHSSLIF